MHVSRFAAIISVKEESITAFPQNRRHAADLLLSFRAKSRNLSPNYATQLSRSKTEIVSTVTAKLTPSRFAAMNVRQFRQTIC
jgi:hypothetical protein